MQPDRSKLPSEAYDRFVGRVREFEDENSTHFERKLINFQRVQLKEEGSRVKTG